LQALENVDKMAFSTVISEILDKFSIEALYHGNVDQSDAEEAKKLILEMVDESGGGGLPKKKYPKEPVIKIPPSEAQSAGTIILPSLDPTEPNTAVEVYFQVGKDNIEERVLIDLLTHMMYEPLYDQIRTKDQFGYIVSCDSRWTNGVMGMHFRVITSTKSAVSVLKTDGKSKVSSI
jgi:nardilysin